MIRAGLVLFLIAAAAVAVLAMTGDAGRASVVWLGWRADTTAAAAVLITLIAALIAQAVWRLIIWVVEAPARAERARADARRRQANEVLTRGFLAAAAGDGSEARRLAGKAADLADEAPGLARVLAAQAAEAAGDSQAAHAAYSAMLGFPEMRLAGHRGLMQLAAAQGDREGALRHAEQAFALARTARWAWRAVLEARLEAGDWDGALELVQNALDRKIVSPIVADRARSALLAASAARLEHAVEPKGRQMALEQAVAAAKLQPGFAPGVVMAARLLAADGKIQRASQMLEAAWKAQPHPALWLAYRDLVTAETPRRRADRLRDLAGLNPAHRESRILFVEQALIGGDPAGAEEAVKALDGEPVTARIAGLRARVAFAAGRADEARMWMAHGVAAPQEPDWTDLDPEGRAFAYQPTDWARLVSAFAETGELVHPRHERRERVMTELPELPTPYLERAPFLEGAPVEPVLYPAGEEAQGEAQGDDDPTPPLPPRTGARRSASRRRLASAPRAAK
ncbi:heme biosynthesis protein HemY [Phenylobacterium sp.]|uniref:heme biosynthesis protein HemY n=1 Tax=Phenylobacterium sp. TaxID=1871053 RepID=UPI0035B067E6